MVSGHGDFFLGVWGSSEDDVFVVGGNDSSGLGSVLHYNGASWTSMTSGTSNSLYGVWGSSSSDVFAVGKTGTILHYDGNTWGSMPGVADYYTLRGVWGIFGDDVFAVGWGNMFHYAGTSWSSLFSYYIADFFSAWGSSGSSIFSVGSNGTIYYYDGISWDLMSIPSTNDLYDVWGSSGNDVFAVGRSGTILHYAPVTAPIVFVSSNGDCGTKSPCYNTIQNAIDAAASGSDILVKQGTYSESISLASDKILRIRGGYNSTYAEQTANTTFIQAIGSTNIKASKGSLKFEMINVK